MIKFKETTKRERVLAKIVKNNNLSKQEIKNLSTRSTGKTTANILKAVSKAMLNPTVPVKIIDHNMTSNVFYKEAILPLTIRIIKKLKLKGFTLSPDGRTVEYDYNY